MKRIKGSVSLFTAMIFLMVVSVITTTIKAARVKGAEAVVGCAASMALDSLFAEYNSELFSEFGVLLFDGRLGQENVDSEEIAAKVWDYMSYNINTQKDLIFAGTTDLYGIIPSGVSVDKVVGPTDYGGLLWQTMVVEYEKYAKPIDMAADYLGIEGKDKEAEAVNDICEAMVSCTEIILEVNKDVKSLIGYSDGVQCESDGIDFSNIISTGKFVKQFCPGTVTSQSLNIDNISIYIKAAADAVDVNSELEKVLSNVRAGEYNTAQMGVSDIKKLAKKSLECTDSILSILDKIESEQKSLGNGITALDKYIESNSFQIANEVMEGINEEMDNLKNYEEVMAEQVCDISAVKNTITYDNNLLNEIIDAIDKIDFGKKEEDIVGQITTVKDLAAKISFEGLSFDYQRLAKTKEDTSILDGLVKFFDIGILAMVLPKDAQLSSAAIVKSADMASNICDFSNTDTIMQLANEDTKLAKDIIYTEYVMDKFTNFINIDSDEQNSARELNYQAEYILFGENSDVQNLTETVLTIAAIRSGFNMVYLMTDADKKDEAYALAFMMVGASGIEPLVRLVQFSLLYLWAYGEGLADVKTMLGGGKVPLTKTKDTWKLSLEKLLSHSIETEESDNSNGMTYEAFIRFLLYVEDDGKRAARTMDLVELSIMQKSDSSFRMKNMVYSVEAEIAYRLNGIEDAYEYKSVYTY